MIKINFNENKIILVKNTFSFLLNLENKENYFIINPFTKVSDIFSFKNKNIFNAFFSYKFGEKFLDIFNESKINDISKEVNEELGFEFLENNLDLEKNTKNLFDFNKEYYVDEKNLLNIISLIEKYSNSDISIIIYGFDSIRLDEIHTNKVKIFKIINFLPNNITFKELELLLIFKNNEFIEISDINLLINFLEAGTETVINEEKISNYLKGKEDFESFQIHKFLEKI